MRLLGRGHALTVTAVGSLMIMTAPTSAADVAFPNCLGKAATIVGTSGNDRLMGTAGNDVIAGLAG